MRFVLLVAIIWSGLRADVIWTGEPIDSGLLVSGFGFAYSSTTGTGILVSTECESEGNFCNTELTTVRPFTVTSDTSFYLTTSFGGSVQDGNCSPIYCAPFGEANSQLGLTVLVEPSAGAALIQDLSRSDNAVGDPGFGALIFLEFGKTDKITLPAGSYQLEGDFSWLVNGTGEPFSIGDYTIALTPAPEPRCYGLVIGALLIGYKARQSKSA